jgi:hypothetical protein
LQVVLGTGVFVADGSTGFAALRGLCWVLRWVLRWGAALRQSVTFACNRGLIVRCLCWVDDTTSNFGDAV